MAYNADFASLEAMSDSCILPAFDIRQAAVLARELFALDGPLNALHGERDLNYRVDTQDGKFVFKIANAEESWDTLDSQHRVFEILAAKRVFPQVATARLSASGNEIETVQDASGNSHYCRALPFLEGRIWSDVELSSDELLADLGRNLALLDKALAGFSHAGLQRPLLWSMEVTGAGLDAYKPLLANARDLRLVEHFESGYLERVLPLAGELRRGVIHNDANRENVLLDEAGKRVVGIIDFGDMLDTWLVLEPAIAATYSMHGQPDPLASAAALVAGYHREQALEEREIGILYDLIAMRLCMSVCICAHQQRLQPDNDYLSLDLAESRSLLERIQPLGARRAREQFMAACA
jgi:Ser/Thr protein kinase RdoA (MazF antagonist)